MDVAAREGSHEAIAGLWEGASEIYASRLTYVEARAAIGAKARTARRYRKQLLAAKSELEARWEVVEIVELNELVRQVAGLAADTHRLRGADAVHLASAAVLGSGVTMVSRDARLRAAALAAGIDVAP